MQVLATVEFGHWKPGPASAAAGLRLGARFGEKGTHTSRTIMLTELAGLFSAIPGRASRADYATAIIDDNCLHKPTSASRLLTNQRLGELYALDPAVPLFRILHRLWTLETRSRPLLALLAALVRDPLLAATAPAVLSLPEKAELQRGQMREAVNAAVGTRLNDATLDKVVRNAASSWAQSGHLVGRTFKKRQRVQATAPTVAFAMFLGHAAGFRGEELLASPWVTTLDASVSTARSLAVEAKRLSLIDLRTAGDVLEVSVERLDPGRTGA